MSHCKFIHSFTVDYIGHFERQVFCTGLPSLLQAERPNQQHENTEGIIGRIGKQRTKCDRKTQTKN